MTDDTCATGACHRPIKVRARKLCNMHYKREQKAGLTPLDRFAGLVEKSGGCWLWLGSISKGGYGTYGSGLAHRVSWERHHGPIPAGLTIDHRCRTRNCVRVSHLRLMPPSANFSDNGWRDRTHCSAGHEYTEENTRIRIRNDKAVRECRSCGRAEARRARAAQRTLTQSGSPA